MAAFSNAAVGKSSWQAITETNGASPNEGTALRNPVRYKYRTAEEPRLPHSHCPARATGFLQKHVAMSAHTVEILMGLVSDHIMDLSQ